MIVVRKPGSNRRDVSCEIVGRRLPRPVFGTDSARFPSQAALDPGRCGVGEHRTSSTARVSNARPRLAGARMTKASAATAPALVIAAFIVAATAAIASRATIVSAAPRTAVVYAGLGMPVDLRGLSIDRVRATAAGQSENSRELLITGEIVNLRDGERPCRICGSSCAPKTGANSTSGRRGGRRTAWVLTMRSRSGRAWRRPRRAFATCW